MNAIQKRLFASLAIAILLLPAALRAQGPAFTYQGRLDEGGNPASGIYDLRFALYDQASGGAAQGLALTNAATVLSNGLFTVTLDFGDQFPGADRWLEIGVRTNGGGAFATLSPRQLLTATPYAVRAVNAATAATASSVAAVNIAGTLNLTQLPTTILTNGASGVNLSGTFSGNGAGVTNVSLSTLNSYGAISYTTKSGAYALGSTISSSSQWALAVADFNGDGLSDVASGGSSGFTVMTNNGGGGFATAFSTNMGQISTIGGNPVAAFDLNGDGKMDFVGVNPTSLLAFTNDGTGSFTLSSSNFIGTAALTPRCFAIGDVNGDGRTDALVGVSTTGITSIFTNNGSGVFSSSGIIVQSTGHPDAVAVGDINGDGFGDIITISHALSNSVVGVFTNNGSGSFSPKTDYVLPNNARDVVVADLNGDGWADIATANQGANEVTVLTNNQSGLFAIAANYNGIGGPLRIIARDLTGDGRPELITANDGSSSITVLLNNGTGVFTRASNPALGAVPAQIAAGDVNGDGQRELITANSSPGSFCVLYNAPTFSGNGSGLASLNASQLTSGTLGVAQLPAVVVTNGASGVNISGTFTGNGSGLTSLNASQLSSGTVPLAQLPGAVVTNGASGVNISGTFAGNGAGLTNLNAAQLVSGTVPLASLPGAVVTNGESGVNISGTFSGDGAGISNANINLLTSGALSFEPFFLSTSPTVGPKPVFVIAADVNGDGRSDLISVNESDNNMSVLLNNGSGGFVLSGTVSAGLIPRGATSADINGDGSVDLISVTSAGLYVSTNNGSGGFTFAYTLAAGSGARFVTAADVNADGKPDLISANQNANTLTVLTNNGSGGFVLSSSPGVGAGAGPRAVTAADVNADGKPDLISANQNVNTLTVLTNNGSGGFVLASSPGVGPGPASVTAADVNGDGKPDLISANADDIVGNTLTVLTNNGSGGFVLASTPSVGLNPVFVKAADVNGDGKSDLISANAYTNTLSVLTNNGTGGFVLNATPKVGSGPNCVAAVDVNGDGRVDLVSANSGIPFVTSSPNTLSVLLNLQPQALIGTFAGNGSGLTNLSAAMLTGTIADTKLATISTPGKVADTALSANVALLNRTPQNFTGTNTFGGNVGIGTGTPDVPLTVSKGNGSGVLRASASFSDAVNSTMRIAHPSGGIVALGGNFDHDLQFGGFNGTASFTPVMTVGSSSSGGQVGIGTTNPAAQLDIASTTQLAERVRFSGREFYQGQGTTETQGLSMLLGVNRTQNRQLWIADSGRLTQNNSNPVARVVLTDRVALDAVATDGITALPLWLGPNNLVMLSTNSNVGIGTANPTNKLHVVGGATFTTGGGANQTVSWTSGSASWSFTSDRNTKDRVAPVNRESVLDKVTRIPINEWSYIGYDQRHIGPMAQDFHAQFPLNENDKALNDADLHGVALAAIQGLNEKVEGRSQQSEVRIQKLEAENAELKARLSKLEQLLNQKVKGGGL